MRASPRLAQVGHFAGNLFPVPAGFVAPDARPRAWPQPPSRRAAREAPRPSEGECILCAREAQPHGAALQPVFRAAPYRAEAARQRAGGTTARLLFLDEGNHCRCAAPHGCSTARELFVRTSCALAAGAAGERLRDIRRLLAACSMKAQKWALEHVETLRCLRHRPTMCRTNYLVVHTMCCSMAAYVT